MMIKTFNIMRFGKRNNGATKVPVKLESFQSYLMGHHAQVNDLPLPHTAIIRKMIRFQNLD
jgi:hypothetical protein